MSPQPHEGPAEEEVACLTLSPMKDFGDGECDFREILRSFNHRCRNSLNGIKMSLYLFKRGVGEPLPRKLSELERAYHQLEVFFDWLQLVYRPLSLTQVRSPLGRLFDERAFSWRSRFCTQSRTLELVPPPDDQAGDFDPMLLGVGLEAIVEWRAEASAPNTKAILSWAIRDGLFELCWRESRAMNGSGIGAHDDGMTQMPWPPFPVESLAHLLLKRIVCAHGGGMETLYGPTFAMTLHWPHLQKRDAPDSCAAQADHATAS